MENGKKGAASGTRHVLQELMEQGKTCRLSAHYEEALGAYDEVIQRFHGQNEFHTECRVADALLEKAALCGKLNRAEDELMVYELLISLFNSQPEMDDYVALALWKKGQTLNGMGRSAEAVVAFDRVLTRFGDRMERNLRYRAAISLMDKAKVLFSLERSSEAAGLCKSLFTRFADLGKVELDDLIDYTFA